MQTRYIYKIKCEVYSDGAGPMTVESDIITRNNPINMGDSLVLGKINLPIKSVKHDLESEITIIETERKTIDTQVEKDYYKLKKIFKELNLKTD